MATGDDFFLVDRPLLVDQLLVSRPVGPPKFDPEILGIAGGGQRPTLATAVGWSASWPAGQSTNQHWDIHRSVPQTLFIKTVVGSRIDPPLSASIVPQK